MTHPAIIDLPNRVRDRDIFRDKQGRMFVTLGYIQPPDRILSFLKYVPGCAVDVPEGIPTDIACHRSEIPTTEGLQRHDNRWVR